MLLQSVKIQGENAVRSTWREEKMKQAGQKLIPKEEAGGKNRTNL
jgi:hypothetical protein